MSVDLAKAVGHPSKDQPVSWNQRDLLTYAVGVGAKATDLPVVYGALTVYRYMNINSELTSIYRTWLVYSFCRILD